MDIIATSFSVPRAGLNVIAAAKGLIAGAVKICRRDGSGFDTSDKDGALIPAMQEILSADLSAVKWIVVVEKEVCLVSSLELTRLTKKGNISRDYRLTILGAGVYSRCPNDSL